MTTYAITDDQGACLALSDDPVECVRRMRRMYADEPRSLRVVRLRDGVLLADDANTRRAAVMCLDDSLLVDELPVWQEEAKDE